MQYGRTVHIKNHLDGLGWDSIEWIDVAQDIATEISCEYGQETSGFIKGVEFYQLGNYLY